MGLLSRARSSFIELKATATLLGQAPRFLAPGSWNAARLLRSNVERYRDRLALAYLDERVTWGQLNDAANRWANFFVGRGIGPGDVVALLMDNRLEYVFVLLGLSKIRGVTACINTHATGKTLIHAIKVSEPKLVVVGSEHEAALLDVVDSLELPGGRDSVLTHRDGDDNAVLDTINAQVDRCPSDEPRLVGQPETLESMAYIYTSGTTGLPKAAVVRNSRFLMAAFGFGRIMHEATPDDVIYAALPLYHGNAQWGGLGAALSTGAAFALRRKFSASAFWEDINTFGATRFMYIGELCRYLVNQPPRPNDRSHHVRIAVGNGLRGDIWEEFQRRFNIPLIREFYGATEGNAAMVNLEGRPGMVGHLRLGQALIACDPSTGQPERDARGRCRRITELGETGLLIGRISTLNRFDGYVDRESTSQKILRDVFRSNDAYFNSGDLMTLHEDAWISFADRVGDTFRYKGENVSTNEIAEVLNGASGVLESNVYGVRVPGIEGRVGMASLRVDGAFDLESFTKYVLESLPGYQRPHFIRLQSDMRVTGTLKHQKVDYREEGYDPRRVSDPLYFLQNERYVPIDWVLHEQIQSGEVLPR